MELIVVCYLVLAFVSGMFFGFHMQAYKSRKQMIAQKALPKHFKVLSKRNNVVPLKKRNKAK